MHCRSLVHAVISALSVVGSEVLRCTCSSSILWLQINSVAIKHSTCQVWVCWVVSIHVADAAMNALAAGLFCGQPQGAVSASCLHVGMIDEWTVDQEHNAVACCHSQCKM